MRNEISLTDEQIELVFEKAFGCCLTIDSLDFTRDTIENFVDGLQNFQSWNKPDIDECDGFKTLNVREIKIAKGKPKQDLQVVDFGTVRVIYQSQS